jgi:hypothetical protein
VSNFIKEEHKTKIKEFLQGALEGENVLYWNILIFWLDSLHWNVCTDSFFDAKVSPLTGYFVLEYPYHLDTSGWNIHTD